MLAARLIRFPARDQGTLGRLTAPGYECHSLELPDRDNAPNISRIPAGSYRCVWHKSPRFGWCYWAQDVPGRSAILIHPGNLAGDTTKGYKTHSHGCILLGTYRGLLAHQQAVMASRPAVRGFADAMGRQEFTLEIVEL